MLKRERQVCVSHRVNFDNTVRWSILWQEIRASEEVEVIKAYGGALSISLKQWSHDRKSAYALQQKTTYAKKTVSLAKDGIDMLTTELSPDDPLVGPNDRKSILRSYKRTEFLFV